jgi:mannose-6-phosphate isomerase-like protein (cupin superfamily)
MEAQVFELKTPYLKEGRSTNVLAKTDLISVMIKYYNEGGENTLHSHPTEDHVFVVLDGEATFYDKEEKTTPVKKGEGILIPKGWYYKFQNSGGKPLIILRFGASREPKIERISTTGTDIQARSAENRHVEAVPIDGSYWTL